jgi:hypothetical protein
MVGRDSKQIMVRHRKAYSDAISTHIWAAFSPVNAGE